MQFIVILPEQKNVEDLVVHADVWNVVCSVQYCQQLVMVTWWDGHVVGVDGQRTKHRGVSGVEAAIRYDTIEEFNVDSKAEYTA